MGLYGTAHAATLASKRFSVRNGLPTNAVHYITQDNHGYIWAGTSNGLIRYDGYNFLTFDPWNNKDGIQGEGSITDISNDPDNNLLYLFTPRRTMICLDLNNFEFSNYGTPEEMAKEYRSHVKTKNALWQFNKKGDVRRVTYNNGKFDIKIYSKENALLPDSNITTVKEDSKGNAWIVTQKGLVKVKPDGESTIVAKDKNTRAFCTYDDRIVYTLKEGTLVVADLNGKQIKSVIDSLVGKIGSYTGFMFEDICYFPTSRTTYAYDIENNKLFIPQDKQMPRASMREEIPGYKILADNQGQMHIFSKYGFRTLQLLPEALYRASNRSFSITQDNHGKLIIATYGNGLFRYDPKTNQLDHYKAEDEEQLIHTNFLHYAFTDSRGNCWLSSPYGMYALYYKEETQVEYLKPNPNDNGTWANFVRNIVPRNDGNVLLCVRDGSLYHYHPATNTITKEGQLPACAYTWLNDPEGHEWIGTRGAGLFVDGQQYKNRDSIWHIPTNDIFAIQRDGLHRVWIAAWESGLLLTKYKDQSQGPLKFQNFLKEQYGSSRIRDLLIDDHGIMWIATDNGIYLVDTKNKNITEKDFESYNTRNGKFPCNEIIAFVRISSDETGVATNRGVAICKYDKTNKSLQYEIIDHKKGLINDNVHALLSDGANLWIATGEGLTRLSRKSSYSESLITGSTPAANNYSEDCAMKLNDGRIIFGTNDGLMVIRPHNEMVEDNVAQPLISDILVNGISLTAHHDDLPQKTQIQTGKTIVLSHEQNSLTINFTNFNYTGDDVSIYQYYLEGADKTWNQETSQHSAIYTQLRPGTYTFHLRGGGTAGKWSDETTIKIKIKQPWWNTWIAWLVYLAIAAAIAYVLYSNWRKNFKLKQQMEIEKQLNEFRLNFFTHVSHEFRTPLAIIAGATDKIAQNSDKPISKNNMTTLKRGVKRMNNLINQLLEFRKISSKEVRLEVEQDDIVALLKSLYQDFKPLAQQKNINLVYTPERHSFIMPFDKHKVETIIYNLLSNAIKYTPKGGNVSLNSRTHDNDFVITVSDDGPGIAPEQEKALFSEYMKGFVSGGGMGIGLFTSQRMAQIHKGSLTYHRANEEGGSVFTLKIPAAESAYTSDDYARKLAVNPDANRHIDITYTEVSDMKSNPVNDITVAVVEDDPDMLEQISSELSVFFHVRQFDNGNDALKGIDSEIKLVVCDVMMPDINGFEVVHSLKENPKTDMIPVIMLTAIDDDMNRMRAIKAGADDYLVKPCNGRLLCAKALQLIDKVLVIQERTAQVAASATTEMTAATEKPSAAAETAASAMPDEEAEAAMAEAEAMTDNGAETLESEEITEPAGGTKQPLLSSVSDKTFLQRLEWIVAAHISDKNFSVDQIAEALKISRTKVYYMVKRVTGMSPNSYILKERMRIAANLVLEGKLTVSEISDKVGFQNPAYFTRCFRTQFGLTPSKYREHPEEAKNRV